jgi:hypothetical protein
MLSLDDAAARTLFRSGHLAPQPFCLTCFSSRVALLATPCWKHIQKLESLGFLNVRVAMPPTQDSGRSKRWLAAGSAPTPEI